MFSEIAREFIPIETSGRRDHDAGVHEDPFISGLRRMFAGDEPKPATVSTDAGLDKSTIRKMLDGTTKSPKIATAVKIAAALGVTVEDIVGFSGLGGRTASIVGVVGAGARVPVFNAYPDGGGPAVVAPPGVPPDAAAVEVEGDSMEPVFSAGDLLFYRRITAEGVPSEAVGHRCVCEDAAGLGWVKQVKLGSAPGLYNLISLNPTADNMHDVRLTWAAPVLLHWPAWMARKVRTAPC